MINSNIKAGHDDFDEDLSSTTDAELLIMLHGFGGDHTFLHLSASTMVFMNSGSIRSGLDITPVSICNSFEDTMRGATCTSFMAPGGFLVFAPNGSSCPLSLKTW